MAEVLAPAHFDIEPEFNHGFEGMTETPVQPDDLLRTREALITKIVGDMPPEHRRFLISFKCGNPDWDLLGVSGVENLPAVRRRLENLPKLSPERRSALLAKLKQALDM